MSLGKNILLLRNSKNLSVTQLADITGISQSYLTDIENEKKKNPSLQILMNICSLFNITVSELIGETEPALTPELKALLDSARELSPEQIQKLSEFLKSMK